MSYKSFISHLKSLLETIDRYDTDITAGKAMLKTAWIVGREVYKYQIETGETIKTISLDAGAAKGAFEKYVRFYKQNPNGYKDEIDGHPVNWSHYAALIYVGDKKMREFYLANAAKEGWSSHELRRRIRNNFYENSLLSGSLGPRGTGTLKEINQRLYTYAAEVLKVIDGDTLTLSVDIGFCTKMEHKVRLRGINCPEIGTKKGEQTKAFVESELLNCSPCPSDLGFQSRERSEQISSAFGGQISSASADKSQSVPVVVIRTYKSEKFGRYLVDLWYMKGESSRERILAEGQLLNQVLLDKGFAFKVE